MKNNISKDEFKNIKQMFEWLDIFVKNLPYGADISGCEKSVKDFKKTIRKLLK